MAKRKNLYALLGKYHELKHIHPVRNKECEEEALMYFIYQCNAMERSSLTLEQVKDVVTSGVSNVTDNNREELEAIGVYEAMKYVNKLVEGNVHLDEAIVKELHSLVYATASSDFKGQYRTDFITIPHARNFPPVRHVSYHMNKLFEEYEEMQNLDIIQRVALFHLKFEHIHPFGDGNGQVGRLIINHQLMRAGYPPIAIHVSNKKEYFKAFEAFYTEGDDRPMQEIIVDTIADELKARINILSKKSKAKAAAKKKK